MTTDLLRAVDVRRSRWKTGAGRRRSAALAAALGVTALMLSAAPALAGPKIEKDEAITVVPGTQVCVRARDVLDPQWSTPRFTDVTFSTEEYYVANGTGIVDGQVCVTAKTSPALNSLPSPPPDPFTVTATLNINTHFNIRGTGTLKFATTYNKGKGLMARQGASQTAPYGTLISTTIDKVFLNAGTNPRFTDAVFSTMEYYDQDRTKIDNDRVFVDVKTAEELNALPSAPPSPFTVTANLTMTNDEGETVTGTMSYVTEYLRNPTPGATPTAPSDAPQETPTPKTDATVNVSTVGILISIDPEEAFDNLGTNPKFTAGQFSTEDYFKDSPLNGVANGRLYFWFKTAAELNDLPSPPPSPFTVTATVTMTNDEGHTATGSVNLVAEYARDATPAPPADTPKPTPKTDATVNVSTVGILISIDPEEAFDNLGTNPKFTAGQFSTEDYFKDSPLNGVANGRLYFWFKTAAELNALPSPPPSPFTVTATVTMTNDEGHTATGSVDLVASYVRDEDTD